MYPSAIVYDKPVKSNRNVLVTCTILSPVRDSAERMQWPIKTKDMAINGRRYIFLGMDVEHRDAGLIFLQYAFTYGRGNDELVGDYQSQLVFR